MGVEGNETVVLNLTAHASYVLGTMTQGTVTIADNDLPPPVVNISVSDATTGEPSDSGGFTVTRDVSGPALTVYYSITGSATNGTDYMTLMGNAIIPSGMTSAPVMFMINDDQLIEGMENVTLTLQPNANYVMGGNTLGTVNITDNDYGVMGSVRQDNDADGIQDIGEPAVAGIIVELQRPSDGFLIASTSTNADGNYQLVNVMAGTYYVHFKAPQAVSSAWRTKAQMIPSISMPCPSKER